MSHKTPHIKKFDPKDSAHDIETITEEIGQNLQDSGEAPLIAQGVLVSGASVAVHGAIAGNNSAKTASKTATTNLKNKKNEAIEKGNASAVIMEQLHPNDPDYWRGKGYKVTMEEVPDTVQAEQATHCSVVQSENLGDVLVHNTPVDNADSYRDFATKGPVADRTQYVDVTNYEDGANTSSSRTIHLPADMLNVPLNFIIISQNSLGAGVESVPYGGGRRFQ